MFIQTDLNLKLCLVFILYFANLISNLEIERIHDPFETKIAKKLIKYIDEKVKELPHTDVKNDVSEDIFNNDNSNSIQGFNQQNKGINQVLVKSIIPHGMKTFGNYFGKTFYRPLIRFHKNTDNKYTIHRSENKGYFINKKNQTNPYAIKLINWMNTKYNTLNSYKQKYRNVANYVKTLYNNLGFNKHVKTPMNDKIKKILRFDLSDENNYGQKGYYLNVNRKSTTAKRKWLPDYPFWGYWTVRVEQTVTLILQTNI